MDVEARSDNLLPIGKAVGMGAASAFACQTLIVLLGVWSERVRKRREGYVPMQLDKSTGLDRIPPEGLVELINSRPVTSSSGAQHSLNSRE
jgi:hypothetical protein